MALTTLQKLERIKNRSTKYELVAVNGDNSVKLLAGYCKRNKAGALSMLRMHADAWVKLTKDDGVVKSGTGLKMGDWLFAFSGRTQRESIIGGELKFITEHMKEAEAPVVS